MRPSGTSIVGIGVYRPDQVVTNEDICRNIDSTPEWIEQRTGIESRRFASLDENVGTMSVAAMIAALDNTGLDAADLGAVLIATSTNHRIGPNVAPTVAAAVGAKGVPAFDIAAGCSGFGHGLALASDMIRSGTVKTAAVVGVDQMSPIVDPTDRSISFIFGDGAGAAIVCPSEENGIGPVAWGSQGEDAESIAQDVDWLEFFGKGNPSGVARPYMRMSGTEVFRWAIGMGKAGAEAVKLAGLSPEDIDVFIPHQANGRINSVLAKQIGLREGVPTADDIRHSGNTSAASIPLAMDDLLSTGRARSGDTALLLGYGAGLAHAAQVVRLP